MPLVFGLAIGCGNDVEGRGADDPPPGSEPVYYGEVERILRDNCVECHSTDPDRLAPFSLVGYEAAAAAAIDTPMAFSVMNRVMPPYYANNDGTCQTFHGTKWLTDEEIDTVIAWTNGAQLAGDPANTVEPPPPPVTLGSIDRTLDIGVDYLPDPSLDDDYRCFVVDAIGANQFLTGVHVRPGNATVAHHVIVFQLASDAAEADVVARDAAAPGPGYPCSNGASSDGASFLTGWAPGQAATIFPAGTGIAVAGARKLVVQMHYNLANSDGRPDRTRIDLALAASVQKQAQMVPVKGNVELEPRLVDAIATGTRVLSLPGNLQSARVWGGMIHMHGRGTGAEVSIDAAADTCLMDLDGWSFHWQHMYWYDEAVTVARGDTLRVTCHYDTTAETQTVRWGEGTDQEMCLAYLYVSQ
ncbi:MAG: hypothetical protein H0X17_07790 [Deltaproteobacteria bacterium]|nr:hypothetical protein [Deltaproteobacteria bacterium]